MTHGHGMWENTNRQTAGTVSVDVSAELKGQAWRKTVEAPALSDLMGGGQDGRRRIFQDHGRDGRSLPRYGKKNRSICTYVPYAQDEHGTIRLG